MNNNNLLVYMMPYASYITGEVRLNIIISNLNGSNKFIEINYPYLFNHSEFYEKYVEYLKDYNNLNNTNVKKVTDDYIRTYSNYINGTNSPYCPFCKSKLLQYNNGTKNICTNIECPTDQLIQNIYNKISLITNVDIINSKYNNIIDSFLSYQRQLINPQTGMLKLNSLFSSIQNINTLISSAPERGVFNKININYLTKLYKQYKNLTVYQYFKLCKMPLEFEDQFILYNKIKLSKIIDSNNSISNIIDNITFSDEVISYLNYIDNINNNFIKEFRLYII